MAVPQAGYGQAALQSTLRWHVADLKDCACCCYLSKGTMLSGSQSHPAPPPWPSRLITKKQSVHGL